MNANLTCDLKIVFNLYYHPLKKSLLLASLQSCKHEKELNAFKEKNKV